MKIKDAKPQVGIFEIVEGKMLSDTEDTQETSESGRYFDGINLRFHKDVVKTLVAYHPNISKETKAKFASNPAEYLKYPRGRIDYDTVDKKWSIMSSRDVLTNNDLIELITREFNLPPLASGKIVLEADEGHYGIF